MTTNALSSFIREQMDDRGMRNRDLEQKSGLSRQLVSKYANDTRESIARLPDRGTLEGLSRGLGVSTEFLLGKAVEALGLGYTSGDFVNALSEVDDDDLLRELRVRLARYAADSQALAALEAGATDQQFSDAAQRLAAVPEEVAAHQEDTDIEEEQGHDEHP